MNDKKQDPLEAAVLVDQITKQNRARQLLAEILGGRVEIDLNTGNLELLPKAFELSAADIILVLLSGKLAQKLLSTKLKERKSKINEKMTQKDIIEFLPTVDPGNIRASLHNLRSKNLIRNEEGGNFVSLSQLQKIKNRLTKRQNE